MFDGVHLTLLIGPLAVPLPAPLPVTEALQSVQVSSQRERTGFQLTFSVGKTSILQQALLPAGFFDPIITRVVLVVTFRGVPTVICDGVITRHEIAPSSEAGQSTLTVTGEDLSVLMDVIEKKLPYPAMPDVAKLNAILAPYALFGVTPLVIPPPVDTPRLPTQGYETQTGTDLSYIKSLASRCGYVFYLEPGPAPAAPTWPTSARMIKHGHPAAGAQRQHPTGTTNVDLSLSFEPGNGLRRRVVFIQTQITRGRCPIPMPNIDPLQAAAGRVAHTPANIIFMTDSMANLSPDEAFRRARPGCAKSQTRSAAAARSSVLRYGHPAQGAQLVGVRGAGLAYDGLYYVKRVKSTLKRGEFKQSFELTRNGLISSPPGCPYEWTTATTASTAAWC
jgi:hypothetical protein